MTKIAVNGASGRMGTRILALAPAQGCEAAGAFDDKGTKLSAEALKKAGKGVLIDFSSPAGTLEAIEAASQAGWGLIVGTTGLEQRQADALKKASERIPVVFSYNMSVGVNLVAELLEMLAKRLPADFKLDITEAHHIHKKDAPSGTAIMLLNAFAGARGWDAARTKSEKDRIKAIREGEIVGDHSVLFAGPAETIEIKHHAVSRDIFASGALVAAKFAASARPGMYNMRDVLKK